MYRDGFAHPLSLMYQRSKLLAETIYFVCSVRVGSLRAYTNRQSTPRAPFVCPCSLFSVDRLVLQSFAPLWLAILAKGVRARQQSLTTQTTLRPSCRLDRMPRLASPRQVGGRLYDFSELVRSFGMPRAKLLTYCNRLAICTPRGGQTSRGVACMLYSLVDLVAFHNRRANRISVVIHAIKDDTASGCGGEFLFVPIPTSYFAVLVPFGHFAK